MNDQSKNTVTETTSKNSDCTRHPGREQLRYISHLEDDPMVWSGSFADLEEAVIANCRAIRIQLSAGSGDVAGAIYDREEKRIVAYCDPWSQDVIQHHGVTVTRFPNPDFLQRCARVVEGFESGELKGIGPDA